MRIILPTTQHDVCCFHGVWVGDIQVVVCSHGDERTSGRPLASLCVECEAVWDGEPLSCDKPIRYTLSRMRVARGARPVSRLVC